MALRAIWQFTDWAVQARMAYGPKPVLADIPQQPLVNKQFDPGFHSDLMTG